MELISERKRVTEKWYCLDYYRKEDNQVCLSFPCDAQGNVKLVQMTDAAVSNYQLACNNDRLNSRVNSYSSTYTEPAVGKCEVCGRPVDLVDMYCGATECECGQWYNIAGQALTPPDEWEEAIDYDY